MKIITTTGFYGTGSSAITDLFSEMNNVCVKGDYEFRFVCDPDGISDLEYNLVENPNRHNTSNAIKRFKKQVKFLNGGKIIKRYNTFFGNSFIEMADNYIDNICLFKYIGRWHFDLYERGVWFWIASRSYSKFRKLFDRIFKREKEREYTLLSDKELSYAGTFCESVFLQATQQFIDGLFCKFNTQNKEYVMLDQLVPPTNLGRYIRYFSNIKIFVVDRDPRDIFLLEKLYWHGKVAPVYDVKIYCNWYQWTRQQFEIFPLPECVMKIQFEDIIYKYDETCARILSFVGIKAENHIEKFSHLNPDVSKNNTKLWKKHPQFYEEIKYIEEKLKKYCYIYTDSSDTYN